MKSPSLLLFLIVLTCIYFSSVLGCGSKGSISVTPPKGVNCTGVSISGVLKDSLTDQPVQHGLAFLENGTQIQGTKLYNFAIIQQTAADASGTFTFCPTAIFAPSALVLIALDSSGNAYPPFVAPISETVHFGTIPMGGCRGECGFEGQQQTSLPATVKGVITSSPISKSGTLFPQYAMNAPDASGATWDLIMPAFNIGQGFAFITGSSGCAQSIPFCAAYSFSLPSQNAVFPVKGGYSQQTGSPFYLVLASVTGTPTCVPPSVLISFQQDGKSPLQGTPGTVLTAAPIHFSRCQ